MKRLLFLASLTCIAGQSQIQAMFHSNAKIYAQQRLVKIEPRNFTASISKAEKETMSYLQGGALVVACGFIGWAGYTIYKYHTNMEKYIHINQQQQNHELSIRPRMIHQALDQHLPPVLTNIVNEYDVLCPEDQDKEFWNTGEYYFNRHPDIKKMKRYANFAGCATALIAAFGLAKTFNFKKGNTP